MLLHHYLYSEALKDNEDFGYSVFVCQAAKKQSIGKQKESYDIRGWREDHSKGAKEFADLLDVTVMNLKEAKGTEELGNGALHHKLQRKTTERKLT